MYREQIYQGWPGLAKELKEVCQGSIFKNINEGDVSKVEIEDASEDNMPLKQEGKWERNWKIFSESHLNWPSQLQLKSK